MSADSGEVIRVLVNGEALDVPLGCSVADVVARYAPTVVAGRGTAVAVNEDVVPASRWEQTTVAGGAQIELVQAVAGG